jgi:hypothetical protein
VNGHGTNGRPGNGNGNGHSNGATRLLPTFDANPPSRPDLRAVPRPAREWDTFAGPAVGATGRTAKLDPSGFTWFITNGKPSAPAPSNGESAGQPNKPLTYTDVGLPRRVPRSHAVPSLVQPPAGRHGGPVRQRAIRAQDAPAPAPQRDPSRARGFLADYQAGIRQGQPDSAESASHGGTHGTGQGEAQ